MLDINDDGFAQVRVGERVALIDLYKTFNKLVALDEAARKGHPGDGDGPRAAAAEEYLDGVCALMVELGLGEPGAISHRAADKFDDAIFAAVDALKKSDAPTPA